MLKDLFKEISKYNGKYEIYVGINERENNGDKDENVKFITNIGHDIDALRWFSRKFIKSTRNCT